MSLCGFHREIWLLIDGSFLGSCEPIFPRMRTSVPSLFSRGRRRSFLPSAWMLLWLGELVNRQETSSQQSGGVHPPLGYWRDRKGRGERADEGRTKILLAWQPSPLPPGGWEAQEGDQSFQDGDAALSQEGFSTRHQPWPGSHQAYDPAESRFLKKTDLNDLSRFNQGECSNAWVFMTLLCSLNLICPRTERIGCWARHPLCFRMALRTPVHLSGSSDGECNSYCSPTHSLRSHCHISDVRSWCKKPSRLALI